MKSFENIKNALNCIVFTISAGTVLATIAAISASAGAFSELHKLMADPWFGHGDRIHDNRMIK